MRTIDLFEMERMQSLHWHVVEYDLSESGVTPLSIGELVDPDELARIALGYPLSEGSELTRERIAQWYPDADTPNVTVANGGSEANHLTLWTLLEPGDRLAFMVPNYMQGWGLGRHYGEAADTFRLVMQDDRWALDLDELERAVGPKTKAVMVCNPNNPTGHVLTQREMDAVITAAGRMGAWLVCDEIYRGAEVDLDESSPTFWGRYDKVIVTSGLSKAFAMPGLRIGWTVAPSSLIEEIWVRHDYTTLTPGMVSDKLAAIAMEPDKREWILARTREIIRRNLPSVEEWIRGQSAFRYVRPTAGAIAYMEYDLDVGSTELADRIRREQSVLVVPGGMLGLDKGIRIGFGYDPEETLKGLERLSEVVGSV